MLYKVNSEKLFLVTGVMCAEELSLEQIISESTWFKIKKPPSGVGVATEDEEHTPLEEGKVVIFALRYQAFRFKRFSKKVELVNLNIK